MAHQGISSHLGVGIDLHSHIVVYLPHLILDHVLHCFEPTTIGILFLLLGQLTLVVVFNECVKLLQVHQHALVKLV